MERSCEFAGCCSSFRFGGRHHCRQCGISVCSDHFRRPLCASCSGGAASECAWAAITSGEAVQLQLVCQRAAYCYLLHLNEKDELSIIFPNRLDHNNFVELPGSSLLVPSRFAEPEDRYLTFTGQHRERETLYLLTSDVRLEETIGELQSEMGKLPSKQARELLRATQQRPASITATTLVLLLANPSQK